MMAFQNEWARADAVKLLMDHRSTRLVDWTAIADELDFDLTVVDDPMGVTSISTLYAIFERVAEELQHDAIIFDIYHSLDVGAFSVFDYLFLCAPSLRGGCRSWVRFFPLRSNAYQVRFEENETEPYFEWPILEGRGEWRQNLFARVAWAARQIEVALDDPFPPVSFEIAAPEPKRPSRFLDRYRGRIRFGSRQNRILFPPTLLETPLKRHEQSLYAIIEQTAINELEALEANRSPLSQISAQITDNLTTGAITLPQVAENLGQSARAVQRTLEKAGTSYRQLTEEIRRSTAARYLQTTDLPMKEVAFLVGFSELSTFSRAVKNWFGVPPRKFRENFRNTIK